MAGQHDCGGLSLSDLAFAIEFDEGAPLPAAQRPSAGSERAAEDSSAPLTPTPTSTSRRAVLQRKDILENFHVEARLREVRQSRRQKPQSSMEMLDVDAVGALKCTVSGALGAPSKAAEAARGGEGQQEETRNASIDRFREALQGVEFDLRMTPSTDVVASGFDEALLNHEAPARHTWESPCETKQISMALSLSQ